MIRRAVWLLPLAIFLSLVAFFWKGLSLNPRVIPSVKIGQSLPKFSVARLDSSTIFTSSMLPHRPFLLHVWASWCGSCQEESLLLLSIAQQGIPLYGLNYKDHPAAEQDFLQRWGNPYAVVLQDQDGKVALDLGVYGTPETFLIDARGIIRDRHVGVLSQDIWDKILWPQMRQLEQTV